MTDAEEPLPDWHALDADEVLLRVESTAEGLSQAEAEHRQASHGPNRLPAARRRGPIARLTTQFNNLLIQVLIVAAVVTGFLGHSVDTWVILGVVVVNAVIGFAQEGKAEKALDAIRHMLSPRASVTRDGQRRTLPAEELVPGDLVLIEPGDKVPADLRLLRARNLRIQEAVLTGESVAVEKSTAPVEADAELAGHRGMAFSGTLVSSGQGVGVVVATGTATQIGRISGLLSDVESMTTPLLEQMDRFARLLAVVIVGIAAAVFAWGLWGQGRDATEMFMTVVGLAVAAIPEGLPAILTVTLAIGVQRMAGRNAIIRRLPAVETLGSVSTICSDKTGTLTCNQMTLRTVVTPEASYAASGVGYDPHGGFSRDGGEVDPRDHPGLLEMLRVAARCNDAGLHRTDGEWRVEGDPMEGALLVGAMKAGLDLDLEDERLPRSDVIPFETEHRLMATLHHDHQGQGYLFVKGAPERIMDLCSRQRADDDTVALAREDWETSIVRIAGEGQRVLGLAIRRLPANHRELTRDDLDADDMVFLGLLGLMDPPREEAIEAVHNCQAAGIRVKMITGDHALTARGIARQLHLTNPDQVITGRELDAMSDAELARRVGEVDVFARTTPENKLRLVEALQAERQVVAMTGDGVNDAPALKRADVGVSMGHGGTEVAREASEMVLADDNFASVAHAVREGRTVYDNLKKAILFLLPVNGGESLAILTAVMAGLTLPITPLQILWVNMVSSVALAMALAFEPPADDVMRRPPRQRDEAMLSGFLLWRISFVSLLFVSGVFGIFAWSQYHGSTLEEARTYAVNTLVVMEVFYLFSIRYLDASSLGIQPLKGTRAVLIAVAVVVSLQLLFTYAPFMERFFDTRPVDFVHGVEIIGIGLALFVALELEKWLRRRWKARRSVAA